MDERLQLYSLAHGGVVNPRRTATLSSLVNRGIVRVDDTGIVRFRSESFGEFIVQDIDHGELHTWRKEGGGGAWRMLWPPLAIGAVLGLMFLAMANPEMRTTLLTALLGASADCPALLARRAEFRLDRDAARGVGAVRRTKSPAVAFDRRESHG